MDSFQEINSNGGHALKVASIPAIYKTCPENEYIIQYGKTTFRGHLSDIMCSN